MSAADLVARTRERIGRYLLEEEQRGVIKCRFYKKPQTRRFEALGHIFRRVDAWVHDLKPKSYDVRERGRFPATLCMVKRYALDQVGGGREGRASRLAAVFLSDLTGLAVLQGAVRESSTASTAGRRPDPESYSFAQLCAHTEDPGTYRVLLNAWSEQRRISRLQELQAPALALFTREPEKRQLDRLFYPLLLPLRRPQPDILDRLFRHRAERTRALQAAQLHFLLELHQPDAMTRKVLLGAEDEADLGDMLDREIPPVLGSEWIEAEGFKCFGKEDAAYIDLSSPAQIAFGENGTGKSSLVDAISVAQWSGRDFLPSSVMGRPFPGKWLINRDARQARLSCGVKNGPTTQVEIDRDKEISRPTSDPWVLRQEDIFELRHGSGLRYGVLFWDLGFNLALWYTRQASEAQEVQETLVEGQRLFNEPPYDLDPDQRQTVRRKLAGVLLPILWATSIAGRIRQHVRQRNYQPIKEPWRQLFAYLKRQESIWWELIGRLGCQPDPGHDRAWAARWASALSLWSRSPEKNLAADASGDGFVSSGDRYDAAVQLRENELRSLLLELAGSDWLNTLSEVVDRQLAFVSWAEMVAADTAGERFGPLSLARVNAFIQSWCATALGREELQALSGQFTFLVQAIHSGWGHEDLSFRLRAGRRDLELVGRLERGVTGDETAGESRSIVLDESDLDTFLNSAQKNLVAIALFVLAQWLRLQGEVPRLDGLPLVVLDDVAQDLDDAHQQALAQFLRKISAILPVRLLVTTNQRALFQALLRAWVDERALMQPRSEKPEKKGSPPTAGVMVLEPRFECRAGGITRDTVLRKMFYEIRGGLYRWPPEKALPFSRQ